MPLTLAKETKDVSWKEKIGKQGTQLLLEGDMIAYDGVNPWQPTEMRMGVRDIRVTEVQTYNRDLYLLGENFTTASEAVIGDDNRETVYISSTVLLVPDCSVKAGDTVAVAQISQKGLPLSQSAPYTVP